MADIKLKKVPSLFRAGHSHEETAEVIAAFDKQFVGAEQQMQGEGHAEVITKFTRLLASLNPKGSKNSKPRSRNFTVSKIPSDFARSSF